jgi:recombination protein RecT
MTAAQLGLEPDNVLGQVYLVPFKEWGVKKAQVIVGYKGYVRLADNAGWSLKAVIVRQADDFDWAEGTESYIKHKPSPIPASEANLITHVYVIATHRATGYKEFGVMTIAEVHAIRDRSEGYQYAIKNNKKTPWIGPDYEWMVKKTGIRQIAPRLPVQVQKAAMIDAMADQGKTVEIDPNSGALKDVSPTTSANQPETLKGMEEEPAHAAEVMGDEPMPGEPVNVTPQREYPI